MAVKIRLMRIGSKGRPFYRVVAVDERAKRTGKYLELLGTYNPLTEPKQILIKEDRVKYWVERGAQKSVGYLRITGRAPQKKARPAKKAKAQVQDTEQKVVVVEEATTEGDIQVEGKPAVAEASEDKQG